MFDLVCLGFGCFFMVHQVIIIYSLQYLCPIQSYIFNVSVSFVTMCVLLLCYFNKKMQNKDCLVYNKL